MVESWAAIPVTTPVEYCRACWRFVIGTGTPHVAIYVESCRVTFGYSFPVSHGSGTRLVALNEARLRFYFRGAITTSFVV
jgi:hypothetical protein